MTRNSRRDQEELVVATFILQRTDDSSPQGSPRRLRGWCLDARDGLPVVEIIDRDGEKCGWVIGWPIDVAGARVIESEVLLTESQEAGAHGGEHPFPEWGGRYLAVLLRAASAWCYGDACGSLTAFYSQERQAVASSWELLDNGVRYEQPVQRALEACRKASGTWYPFGWTDNPCVRLLVPNHALDMMLWQAVRWWPRGPARRTSSRLGIESRIRSIVETTRAQIGAVSKRAELTLNLTAGRDSRMLLGCARPFLGRIVFTTDRHHSEVDDDVARRIAEVLSLTHIGTPVGMPDRVYLPGMIGEVGRAFYWNRCDRAERRISTDELFERMHFREALSVPAMRAALNAWRDSLPEIDTFEELDLLYLELRVGCVMSPALHCEDQRSLFAIMPFNHPKVIRAMLELPVSFRRRQRLVTQLCEMCWPELLLFPFNSVNFAGVEKYRAWRRFRTLCSTLSPQSRAGVLASITRGRSLLRMVYDDTLFKMVRTISRML